MGMEAGTGMVLASILGPTLGGLMGPSVPEGQELKSFEGSTLDPSKLGGDLQGLLSDVLGSQLDQLAQPVTIHTTVPNLPQFHGGALPMPISVPAGDPNRMNPALRTLPGINIPRRSLDSLAAGYTAVPTPPGGVSRSQQEAIANVADLRNPGLGNTIAQNIANSRNGASSTPTGATVSTTPSARGPQYGRGAMPGYQAGGDQGAIDDATSPTSIDQVQAALELLMGPNTQLGRYAGF